VLRVALRLVYLLLLLIFAMRALLVLRVALRAHDLCVARRRNPVLELPDVLEIVNLEIGKIAVSPS